MLEKEEDKDVFEEAKIEDSKRKFAEPLRPNNRIWNFIDDSVEPTPHILRAQADPNAAYIDGRVGDLIGLIEELGIHLKNKESENWKRLNDYTIAIFQDEEEKIKEKYEAWEKEQGQQ